MGARRRPEPSEETLQQRTGRILTEQMLGGGLIEADVVRRSGVRQSTVHRILKGQVDARVGQLVRVARALGLTLDQATGNAPPPSLLLAPRAQRIMSAYYEGDKAFRDTVDRMLPETED